MPDWDIIAPPSSFTVDHDHKPVLYTAEGKALVRQAGFTAGRHVQGSGVCPPLSDNTSRRPKPKKSGKK